MHELPLEGGGYGGLLLVGIPDLSEILLELPVLLLDNILL